jgi:hypothetical protein
VKQFYRVDGKIRSYQLHPSNEYVVILTDAGFYYIFNVEKGDIRGKQVVDPSSTQLQIDPSGLYLSVVANKTDVHIYELAKGTLIGVLETNMGSIAHH